MSQNGSADSSQYVYRVDKFVVPAEAKEEFVQKVRATQELLKTLPGFRQGHLLENTGDNGQFHLVTFVEWENFDAIPHARTAVAALHEAMQFHPQEMIARLGIQADLGLYTPFSR